MTKKLILLALIALAIVVLPSAVTAQKPNQKPDQSLSIAASPETVRFGGELRVTGRLTGGDARRVSGRNVTLQSDPFPYDGKFERIGTADTAATGDYSFTLKPATNARYRTIAKGGTASPVITVPVRMRVTRAVSDRTPKKGARVKFSGRVTPAHDGAVVRIQRHTSTGWKTIAKTTLADAGEERSVYSERVPIRRSCSYRVFSPGDKDHAAGKSRRVRITVG